VLPLHLAGTPEPRDRLLQPGPDRGAELVERAVEGVLGHPKLLGSHAVEPLGELADRLLAARSDGLADGPDDLDGRVHVDLGARHDVAVVRGRAAAQVDTTDHAVNSRCE
jgi:hypothetical protein